MASLKCKTLMVIGPPAVGKTTLTTNWIKKDGLDASDVLDPDYFRRYLYGTLAWERGEKTTAGENALWSWIDSALRLRAAFGINTVLTMAPRAMWQLEKREKAAHPSTVGILQLSAPVEVLIQRDQRRDRTLGFQIVLDYHTDFSREFTPEALTTRYEEHYFQNSSLALKWLQA